MHFPPGGRTTRRSPPAQNPGARAETRRSRIRFPPGRTCRWNTPARRRCGRPARRNRGFFAAGRRTRRNAPGSTPRRPPSRGRTSLRRSTARPPARGQKIRPARRTARAGRHWRRRRCGRPCAPRWTAAPARGTGQSRSPTAVRAPPAPRQSASICRPARRTDPARGRPAAAPVWSQPRTPTAPAHKTPRRDAAGICRCRAHRRSGNTIPAQTATAPLHTAATPTRGRCI